MGAMQSHDKQLAVASLSGEWQQFACDLDNPELTICLANSLDIAVEDSGRADLISARDAVAAYAFGAQNAPIRLAELREQREALVRRSN